MEFRNLVTLLISCLSISVYATNSITINDIKPKIDSLQTEKDFEWFSDNMDYLGLNDINEKQKVIQYCIERAEKLKLERTQIIYLMDLSVQKTITGEYPDAISLVNQSIDLSQKVYPAFLSNCYNHLANTVDELGDKDLAIEYIQKAITYVKQEELEPYRYYYRQINNYIVYGKILIYAGRLEEGLAKIQIADSLINSTSYSLAREKGYVLINYANIYSKQSKHQLAQIALDSAIQICLEHKFPEMIGLCYLRKARDYKISNLKDSALKYYQLAEKVSIETSLSALLIRIYSERSSLYFNLGKKTEALNDFRNYFLSREKLDISQKLAKSQFIIDIVKKEEKKRIERQLKELSVQEKRKRDLIVVWSCIIIALIILSLLIYFLRNRQFKMKEKILQERLKQQMKQSQLTAIRSQMNPHFIFNCLNSIQDLILQKDIKQSNRYLAKFSGLVRKVMEDSNAGAVTLEREIINLKTYIELESLRFTELDYDIKIDTLLEPRLTDIKIPPIIIQPFVENAFKHGLFHSDKRKRMELEYKQENKDLLVLVKDNGIGRKAASQIKERQETYRSFSSGAIEERIGLLNSQGSLKLDLKYFDLEAKDAKDWVTIVQVRFQNVV